VIDAADEFPRLESANRGPGEVCGDSDRTDVRLSADHSTIGDLRMNHDAHLEAHQGANVRHRLRDRARNRSPHRTQPHGGILEHRPGEDSHDGQGKSLVEGARSHIGGRDLIQRSETPSRRYCQDGRAVEFISPFGRTSWRQSRVRSGLNSWLAGLRPVCAGLGQPHWLVF
jgi:hypothetical protein